MTDFTREEAAMAEPVQRPVSVWIRSIAYFIAYWLITANFAILCTFLALMPGRKILGWGLQLYGSAQLTALKYIAGVHVEVRGKERLPSEPVVIGAKHQSWGDGFVMLAHIAQISFVAGDHLYKFPLVGRILKKIGAIVLSNQGGEEARTRLEDGMKSLQADRRDVLIYPEGHLARPGEKHRYRTGVWRLYDALERPCAPVATNLGLAWDQQSFFKTPGRVVVEFLDPIEPGLDKDAFMERLERVVESRTDALVAEGLR
ncbi:MAG: 1-acyl-sn-glycerol-3-phosphate acyltransferase [Alphaproteobacteria bacterium]|nr:1-acyl-sn-glycerol-3-phosphate acyltransferase [Alphaproteobacteria bacterium]